MKLIFIIVFVLISTTYFKNDILAQVDSTTHSNELNNFSSQLLSNEDNNLLFSTQSYFFIDRSQYLNLLEFKPFFFSPMIKNKNGYKNSFDFSFILNRSPFSLQYAIQRGFYGDKYKELNRKNCLW